MTIPSFHAVPRVVRFVANITVPFYSQFHKLHHYSWTIFQTSGIYPLMTQKSLSNFHLRYSSPRLCHYVDKLHCSSRQMCQGPMVQQVQQGKTDWVWFQICPHPVHSHHPWDRKWKVVHCITRGEKRLFQFGYRWLEFKWYLPNCKYLQCAKWLSEACQCGKASLQGRKTICIECIVWISDQAIHAFQGNKQTWRPNISSVSLKWTSKYLTHQPPAPNFVIDSTFCKAKPIKPPSPTFSTVTSK